MPANGISRTLPCAGCTRGTACTRMSQGMDSFEPWLARVEKHMTEAVLGEEAGHIPPEWYGDDWNALERLVERLYARRTRVRELILSARNSGRDPFPNWKVRHA